MKKKTIKRVICTSLVGLMILSSTSCGKKETIVEDYGVSEKGKASDVESSTGGDATIMASGERLRDVYGKHVAWKDEFTVKGKTIKVDQNYQIPDVDGMNVYHNRIIDDGKKDEQKIVEALLGDTAKKLEEIKYVNETDYMTMLYKYRRIMDDRKMVELNGNEALMSEEYFDPYDRTVINASFDQTYKWVDEKDYYIHMYEGKYNGIRFGLILSYDYNKCTKTIFFEPISIKEYFPESNYKSLLISDTNDYAGNPDSEENKCPDNIEEVKKKAQSLVENDLHIRGSVSVTEDPEAFEQGGHDLYSGVSTVIMGEYSTLERGNSVLRFSDVDYLSTVKAPIGFRGITTEILAEQPDHYTDYINSNNSDMSYFEYITAYSEKVMNPLSEPHFEMDGYAVYLQNEYSFPSVMPGFYMSSYTNGNSGIIKYTSKGLYGIDIEIHDEIMDVTENVKLLDFGKIQESLKAELEEQIDYTKMKNPTNLELSGYYLSYFPVLDEDRTSDEFSVVPVWRYLLIGDYNQFAEIQQNAMDGTIVNIQYFGEQ
ncbi:MAG: hypothetical protein K6F55_09300 [Eubacterium sp.]|nr:hypothetical protein [Eubacterium sp.]